MSFCDSGSSSIYQHIIFSENLQYCLLTCLSHISGIWINSLAKPPVPLIFLPTYPLPPPFDLSFVCHLIPSHKQQTHFTCSFYTACFKAFHPYHLAPENPAVLPPSPAVWVIVKDAAFHCHYNIPHHLLIAPCKPSFFLHLHGTESFHLIMG